MGNNKIPNSQILKASLFKPIIFLCLVFILIFLLPFVFSGKSGETSDVTGITGHAVINTGKVELEVLDSVAIDFTGNGSKQTDKSISFGTGYVNEYCDYCEINTEGISDFACCEGQWKQIEEDYILLENIGSLDSIVNFTFSTDATTFFENADKHISSIKFKVVQNESGSCYGNLTNSSWREINQIDSFRICDRFEHEDDKDSLKVYFKFRVPYDVPHKQFNFNIFSVGEIALNEYE